MARSFGRRLWSGQTLDVEAHTDTALSPGRHWQSYYGIQAAATLVATVVTAWVGSVGFATIMNQVSLHPGEKTKDLWVYVAPWAFVFLTIVVARVITVWARGQLRFHQSLWLAIIAQRLHREFDIELTDLNRALIFVPFLKHPKSPYLLRDRLTFRHGEHETIRIQVPTLPDQLMSIRVLRGGDWVVPPRRNPEG
ncbi:hypothetical protein GCM10025867_50440 (plasmid) [Frondihabitans sucicola]|uniref:DUF304 domain-containing protein n=2 Tax=Frondihabitans sucicola TaxID=1268041 RepID=A0ABN6Y9W6_9MICO|nr:hypothetical protein GCM10025867_50440 [Frondihabitans sucicola]